MKIDPCAYLKDVFERLLLLMQNPSSSNHPNLLMPLLPDQWLADHPETQLQIRTIEANTKSTRRTRRRMTFKHQQNRS